MIRADVRPELWKWAIDRVGDRADELRERFPNLDEWQRGEAKPTIRQLEAFASAAYVPIGYLFLSAPPEEPLPIEDFRTVRGRGVVRPSPNLLDAIYLCQRRQAWYRDYAEAADEAPVGFVGSAKLTDAPERVAANMRQQLGFGVSDRTGVKNPEESFRRFIERTEDAGIMVMVSGVVGSNTHRVLNGDEFRGFALSDEVAPIVFVNGVDAKAAQIFTLAHELAHIWLGKSALGEPGPSATHATEVWCNAVAAEFLVPLSDLRAQMKGSVPLSVVRTLAKHFKVSTLVILLRLREAHLISRIEFDGAYAAELARFSGRPSSGGNFFTTQPTRTSKRFMRAVITSAYEGHTSFREAFQMLGFSKMKTLREFGRQLKVLPQ